MRDKWMNIPFEDDELKPYKVADADTLDPTRIEILVSMGYCKKEVEDSLGKDALVKTVIPSASTICQPNVFLLSQ